ncbi:hypothetical protein LGN30_18125 [Burkholderia seminalis]|nr:hypothetical protein [Burkholderia seminalis]
MLIMQGLQDLQVGSADAQRLKQANPAVELVLVADANHVLKAVHTADRRANLAAYSDPDLPLADGIVERIAAFVWKSTTGQR